MVTFPLLMFCVVYGLSIDYEVFIDLADPGGVRPDRRQPYGRVRRSTAQAPLITVAAFTLAASFAVYATGEVMYLQMVGIRGILVPAFMRLCRRRELVAARAARAALREVSDPRRRLTPHSPWATR